MKELEESARGRRYMQWWHIHETGAGDALVLTVVSVEGWAWPMRLRPRIGDVSVWRRVVVVLEDDDLGLMADDFLA
jgi:hypothetical protein